MIELEPRPSHFESQEGEPTEISEAVTGEVEEEEKPFDIDQYPVWQEIWHSMPEADRELLIPLIEAGNLKPEVYKKLDISFE